MCSSDLLNNVLGAIRSLNSGAAAPSTTAAYMLWLDTTNSLLKIRNASDTAWVTLPVDIASSNTTPGGLTLGGNLTFTDSTVQTTAALSNVQQTVKTDTYSTTSTTGANVTGLSVSITPSAATSRVLLLADIKTGVTGGDGTGYFWLRRGTTDIYIGDTLSGCVRASFGSPGCFTDYAANQEEVRQLTAVYIDSPATTSAVTYYVRCKSQFGTSALYINRPYNTSGTYKSVSAASSITAFEIGAA